MTDKMKSLLEKVANDNTLQTRFKECKTPEEQVNLASELGFDITIEEIKEATKLSDDQLDEVSGGGCGLNIFVG